MTARNLILLLFILASLDQSQNNGEENNTQIAQSLVHLWYSAYIPADTLSSLQDKVEPLITDVCSRVENLAPEALFENTWKFNSGKTLRVVLSKQQWLSTKKLLLPQQDLTFEMAQQIRHTITLAPERADYRDRWLYKDASPSMRLGKQRFREDGLLLPFGHPRLGFVNPNP